MNLVLRLKFTFSVIFMYIFQVHAQQTVGIFKNTQQALPGYVLMAPLSDSTTYLINNCGQLVHKWQSNFKPGLSAYLLSDGSLLKPCQINNNVFSNQGGGGLEKRNWDGHLLWRFNYTSPLFHQHHDIAPLPNGNVLLLAFEYKTQAEGIANGRKVNTAVWPEHVIEVQPVGADSGVIVWEWHAWDHAIQQHDSTKAKYGIVADHPELLDLNYTSTGNNLVADWLHGNGIDYNPDLDQIIISSRTFSEFFMIDHSTTTAQAASHSGGKYGKGGDLLYRWGNPEAYGRGDSTHQKLYFQHNANWIKSGNPGAGNIIVFNNGTGRPGGDFSSVDEIKPPQDSAGFYSSPGGGFYGPLQTVFTFKPAPQDSFYSAFIGGMQRLSNGNTLVCEGIQGHLMETDTAGNIVWDYISPVSGTGVVSQGVTPLNNNVFRSYKYPLTYPAFAGKMLTPQGYIELNPGNYNCVLFDSLFTSIPQIHQPVSARIYPNPASNMLTIKLSEPAGTNQICIYNYAGSLVHQREYHSGVNTGIDISHLPEGIYYVLISNNKEVISLPFQCIR